MSLRRFAVILLLVTSGTAPLAALNRPEVTFQVFQFPANQIPRIDGDTADWAAVPDSYVIKTDQFVEDLGHFKGPDPKTLDVKIRVGWVKGQNRLYFLYEAYDDVLDFAQPGLHNDTFEIVVDGDASGGPLIDKAHRDVWTPERVGATSAAPDDRISGAEAHWAVHGVHAQNYHIFTPAVNKDWCMAWSAASWIKTFPHSNAVCRYDGEQGKPGHIVLEFWVTAYDYAGPEGPQRAVESVLRENKIIGVGMAVLDYDDVNGRTYTGFWNLSREHTMFGMASEICAFRLMPLEPAFIPPLEARWSFKVVDLDRRLVAFKDETIGRSPATSWHWDFGDGEASTEQNPLHVFAKPGNYVTILDVTTADGKTSRRSKVWDVQLR